MAAERQKQADAKAAFDSALAANDAVKMEELAIAGNGFALLHRAQILLSSQDFNNHQSGVEDMEAAAEAGNADAQLWVGSPHGGRTRRLSAETELRPDDGPEGR